MLPRDVAAVVGGGAANDGDIGHDRREIQPRVAVELGAADDRVSGGCVVHGAALKLRIDEGAEPDLGEHARPLGCGVAGHVEKNPARHVVCRNFVIHDEAPNGRHRQGGRAGRKGPGDHAGEKAGLCEMVDPLDPVHVARGDGVQRRQSARAAGALEPLADGAKHAIGAAESAGGADRDDGVVGDQRRGFVRRDEAGHDFMPLSAQDRRCRARPARAPGSLPPAARSDRRFGARAPLPNAVPALADTPRRWSVAAGCGERRQHRQSRSR